ncbi:MAG: rod shape-determining protein MreC [Prevotella sp.]|jgi:rod shape-determining protein MreC|nr:rod shape-determining protein MreC [Prevotella sp.]
MKNLLDFLAKYHHWFIFVLLEVASVVLLFQYNSYQNSVWFSSANAMVGKLYDGRAAVESFFSLTKINEELTLRNFYLERQVQELATAYSDLTKDTTKLERQGLLFLQKYKVIPAKVVSNSVDKKDNLITIDKGSQDGVKVDMGVACGLGVVGVVYMTSDHYSVVIPVLNSSSSRISCAIRGRGYFGFLHWAGGDASRAYVEDIPRHAQFHRGEWVVTSGYSSIFPAGVMVGQIEKVFNSPDGLSYRLQVKLATDFANLRDVCVINDESVAEQSRLLRAAQDSIKAKENI